MIDPEYEDLMQRDVDGDTSAEESRRLQIWLAEHPNARASYDELVQLSTLLGQVRDTTPSADLASTLLEEIRLRSAVRERLVHGDDDTAETQQPDRRRHGVRLPAWLGWKPALAFAAGVLVGAVGIGLGLRAPWPSNTNAPMSGSMVPPARSPELQRVDQVELELPGLSGTAVTRRDGTRVQAEVSLRCDHPVQVLLRPENGVPEGLAVERRSASTSVHLLEEGIRIDGDGSQFVTISWPTTAGDAGSLRIWIRDATRVQEYSLRTSTDGTASSSSPER